MGQGWNKEIAMGDERPITCVNDHEVGARARFCSQCGAEVNVEFPASIPPPGSVDSPAKRAPRRLTWWQVTAVFALLASVIYFAVVRPAISPEDADHANDATGQAIEGYSAVAACYDSIAPAVDYLISNNGSDAALNEVLLEFGTNDPRFRLTLDAYSAWSLEASQNGRGSANLIASGMINDWCEANS